MVPHTGIRRTSTLTEAWPAPLLSLWMIARVGRRLPPATAQMRVLPLQRIPRRILLIAAKPVRQTPLQPLLFHQPHNHLNPHLHNRTNLFQVRRRRTPTLVREQAPPASPVDHGLER
jgi:hypothetical protein